MQKNLCPTCNVNNTEVANACIACGASLRRSRCSSCDRECPAEFRFCGYCGSSLHNSTVADEKNNLDSRRPVGHAEPERRQLTVLFCDMVGSTKLTESLDPEDMRELLGRYQAICRQVTGNHGGSISRYVGDGIRTLFGYPHASEHAAEHAVRAGLDIVSAIECERFVAGDGRRINLSVRIGIATGEVVAGDLIGEGASEKEAIVGSAPNLAARLQAIAEPGTLVIAPSTRALTGTMFRCKDLGVHALKGYTDPVQAWQVVAGLDDQTRFEATRKELTPFVNRTDELNLFMQKWRLAKSGQGQVVLLLGDAGIGKSRIVQELHERLPKGGHSRLRYQCSPLHTNTALYPFMSQLQNAAGFDVADTTNVRREKLAVFFHRHKHFDEEAMDLLGNLLGISDGPMRLQQLDSHERKMRVFRLVANQLAELSAGGILLMIVEDLHWIDPTSRELLDYLVDVVDGMSILLVITCRTSFGTSDWDGRANTTVLTLGRLSKENSRTIVRHVTGETSLTSNLVQEIIERTDGVPLFTEEVAKTTMIVAGNSAGEPTVPATLKDSLMERLDQLADAKSVAQVASVVGREFTAELLTHLIDSPLTELHEALERLEQSGIIFPRGKSSPEIYVFKHALVQDAAYASMLRPLRRQIHGRVARYYEDSLDESPIKCYELIAYHYTAAAESSRAVDYWLKAGMLAGERSLNVEAIEHFQNGLRELGRLSHTQDRDCRELALLVNLGPKLLVTRGPGSNDVTATYSKALKLCERTPNSTDHFAALWNWWRIAPNLEEFRNRAEKLAGVASRLSDTGYRLQAHHCQWATAFNMGELEVCCRHIEQGLALYDPDLHGVHAMIYGGHDPKVCALGEQALTLWLMGFSERGLAALKAMENWGSRINHLGSSLHSMEANINFYHYCREYEPLLQHATRMISFAEERGFADYAAKGRIFHGLASAHLGDMVAGLREVEDAIEAQRIHGTKEDFPVYFEILAELFGMAEQPEKGIPLLVDVFPGTTAGESRYWSAELSRRRGELLSMLGRDTEAERSFNESIRIADKQQALSLVLRAHMSLVRLQERTGRSDGGIKRLREVLGQFSEGFNSRDVRDAIRLVG